MATTHIHTKFTFTNKKKKNKKKGRKKGGKGRGREGRDSLVLWLLVLREVQNMGSKETVRGWGQ